MLHVSQIVLALSQRAQHVAVGFRGEGAVEQGTL